MNVDVNTKQRQSWVTYLVKYGVPLVITVGLCWLLFNDVKPAEMWHTIVTQCHFGWIVAALVVSVLSHVARAARWQIQLAALDVRPGLWQLTLSIFGTYAVNLVFPRLGEIWRTGYIAKRQDASFATVFGSMVADRLADTAMVLTLTIITFLLAGSQLVAYLNQDTGGENAMVALLLSPWLWAGIAVMLVVLALLLRRYRHSKAVTKITELVKGLWKGFAVLATMPGKGRWLLLTFAIWGCYFGQLFLAFFAFDATAQVVLDYGPVAVLVCFVLSSISMGVPSNGGIGPWQWAIIFGLGLYAAGVPELTESLRSTFANLVMGANTLLLIALGIFTFICIAFQKKQQHARHQA